MIECEGKERGQDRSEMHRPSHKNRTPCTNTTSSARHNISSQHLEHNNTHEHNTLHHLDQTSSLKFLAVLQSVYAVSLSAYSDQCTVIEVQSIVVKCDLFQGILVPMHRNKSLLVRHISNPHQMIQIE